MINSIQDYLNRASLTESKTKSLDSLRASTTNAEFRNQLESAINEKISGKVASSEITRPVNIKEEIKADPYRKKIFDASVEFESIFVNMMLKEMRKSVGKSGLISGGHAEEIFEDLLYDEYSKEISKNSSLGIAEQVYESLTRNLPLVDKKA
ncbi:MAG: rod-binding protein [Leptospiraceae bacterium]|nr:rod-binding protein [Leptospiraceae bacterium]